MWYGWDCFSAQFQRDAVNGLVEVKMSPAAVKQVQHVLAEGLVRIGWHARLLKSSLPGDGITLLLVTRMSSRS
jgi:hypothetical protein